MWSLRSFTSLMAMIELRVRLCKSTASPASRAPTMTKPSTTTSETMASARKRFWREGGVGRGWFSQGISWLADEGEHVAGEADLAILQHVDGGVTASLRGVRHEQGAVVSRARNTGAASVPRWQ